MFTRSFRRLLAPLASLCLLPLVVLAEDLAAPPAPPAAAEVPAPSGSAAPILMPPPVVFKVQSPNERLEMSLNSSRIVTLDKKISQTQIGNPEMLALTVISPTQIQVSAKMNGVTQVNLWDENKNLYTIDVLVHSDARELDMLLRSTFPNSALKVTPVGDSLLISGQVDKNEHIARIMRIAEVFYSNKKIINNMSVGGVQQVKLHVKVMEVSRTKLRQLGFDWAKVTGSNVVSSGPTGLLSDYNPTNLTTPGGLNRMATASTFAFNVTNGSNAFYGVLDALRQDNFMSILAEPVLVAVNGQPATFNVGGEIPVPEPQSLGTISISWKPYGTQITFVPVVLGDGRISLDVNPEVSELDNTQSVTISGSTVPAIKTRNVHTRVELRAGQTLAIAGLMQVRMEGENRGLPGVSDLPYLGALFRTVNHVRNEVELLVLVTPELVEPMDPDQVPPCGPGMSTAAPGDWAFYMKGKLEVAKCGGPCGNGPCNGDCNGHCNGSAEQVPAGGVSQSAGSNNRYVHAKPTYPRGAKVAEMRNGPPGFIGPVGYDVVK